MGFSVGLGKPGLKPVPENRTDFRGLKSSSPLLKQGAPTKLGMEICGLLPVLTQRL
jgi:hypothetical protein